MFLFKPTTLLAALATLSLAVYASPIKSKATELDPLDLGEEPTEGASGSGVLPPVSDGSWAGNREALKSMAKATAKSQLAKFTKTSGAAEGSGLDELPADGLSAASLKSTVTSEFSKSLSSSKGTPQLGRPSKGPKATTEDEEEPI